MGLAQVSSSLQMAAATGLSSPHGLPTEGVGRIGLSVSQTNRNRVYAIVDAKEGGLFSSNDAGATWTKVSGDNRIWGRGWYFNKVAADPKDPDTVYVQKPRSTNQRMLERTGHLSKEHPVGTIITSYGSILTIQNE
jgi:hypothetical protein